MTNQDIANAIVQGTTIAGDVAVAAAPVVSIYNPAAGAALAALAPFVENFIVTEAGLFCNFKSMTVEEPKAALKASKIAP